MYVCLSVHKRDRTCTRYSHHHSFTRDMLLERGTSLPCPFCFFLFCFFFSLLLPLSSSSFIFLPSRAYDTHNAQCLVCLSNWTLIHGTGTGQQKKTRPMLLIFSSSSNTQKGKKEKKEQACMRPPFRRNLQLYSLSVLAISLPHPKLTGSTDRPHLQRTVSQLCCYFPRLVHGSLFLFILRCLFHVFAPELNLASQGKKKGGGEGDDLPNTKSMVPITATASASK